MQFEGESAESMQVPGLVDALVTSDTLKLVYTLWFLEHSLSDNVVIRFHLDSEEVLLLTVVSHPRLALINGGFLVALEIAKQV